ncbi:MAG: hypothetical protein PW786_00410 [Arachidicoccus sp.]|nr:hypothetical protein [Arachidicoccus sp.]
MEIFFGTEVMHLAWATAAEKDYEFYLWLNDDVYLYNNFLEEIFETYYKFNNRIIVSGIIESIDKSEILYGGYDANKNLVNPAGESKPITYLNGNIVLVSKEIYHMLGNLDPYYCHDLGDVDYGLRALKKNIKIYSTKVPVGAGEKNPICRERLNNTTIAKRFKRLYAPLGSNPKINFILGRNINLF